jgi:hypothetical protein
VREEVKFVVDVQSLGFAVVAYNLGSGACAKGLGL